jgi:hypothetical protein
LIQLEKALGMANTVYRALDRNPQDKGSVIQIRRPTSFTAQAMPISAGNSTDLNPETVSLTLDQWQGVQFALNDKELSFTKEVIIEEHIRPAAVAVADDIDQSLTERYIDCPWFVDAADPGAVSDFTSVKQVMFDNKVPLDNRFLMINGEREADYSALAVFHQANTGVDGEMLQRDGFLGRKFGFDIFANQNVKTHTTGTVTDGTGDTAGAIAGSQTITVGTTVTVNIDDLADGETLVAGDSFVVAGDTQRYAIVTGGTVSSNAVSVTFQPAAKVAWSENDIVTFRAQTKLNENLAYHRNAWALAMAPLSILGAQAGAQMGVAVDPITNLALRSRLFYDGLTAKVFVSLDALWGRVILDHNLAVRMNS